MVWEETKERLKDSVADNVYKLWIEPLKCVKTDENAIYLSGPDRYFSAYVSNNYSELIQNTVSEAGGRARRLVFNQQIDDTQARPQVSAAQRQLRLPNVPVIENRVRNLHPRYTFSEFMVGESNILAQSACRAVSAEDDTIGPCLFINSNTGLGKSHLTHAVAHQVLSDSPMTRLHYLTAQQFSSEMVKGITGNSMDTFKQKYHDNCDILLIEDVHTLAGKKKTQEELNELLDAMIKCGKRIVLTANAAPRDLQGIDSEFCSRMASGLVTSIMAPDLSTRKRIVEKKAAQFQMGLEEAFVEYIAQHIQGDVRQLESAMIALNAKKNLLGGEIEKALILEVVKSIGGVAQLLTPQMISEFVGSQFKVSMKDMQSRSRKKALTFPRQVAMYLSRKHTSESLAEIGRIFNRDHSTVLHSIKKVTDLTRRDNSVEAQVDLLSNKVKQL